MKKINYFVFLFFLTIYAVAEENSEIYMFVPHEFWLTKIDADELIKTSVASGVDTLIVNVWHGRGAVWSSEKIPMNPIMNRDEMLDDPLKYLISLAKENNIQIYPLISVSHKSREKFDDFEDTPGVNKAFNLHEKDVQDMILTITTELINGYSVDGLMLDYIRTKGVCVSRDCILSYKNSTGRSLKLDSKIAKINKEAFKNISQWNKNVVDNILINIKKITDSASIPLAVSSHPGHDGFMMQGADSVSWMNDNLIDQLFSMNYQSIDKMPKNKLASILEQLKRPEDMILIIGNFEKNIDDRSTASPREKIEFERVVNYAKTYNKHNNSLAIFTYRYLSNDHIAYLSGVNK